MEINPGSVIQNNRAFSCINRDLSNFHKLMNKIAIRRETKRNCTFEIFSWGIEFSVPGVAVGDSLSNIDEFGSVDGIDESGDALS